MTDKQAYLQYVNRRAARSPVLRNCAAAFWVGGSICLGGQLLRALYRALGASPDAAGTLVSITLVFFSALATGLGIFDTIARYAGAGTLLPITGFANAVVSPAIDTKSEGFVLGVGAKIFTVAGPVLLYGTAASVLYGLIYWVYVLFS
ncbi:MAG: SpoVA/SpoVAEb family sporulation membrane protein [Clostridia bacterium]|nr:SpoVA/SpoVAEb family sporulation membrane protein [Clostridia bacterium]